MIKIRSKFHYLDGLQTHVYQAQQSLSSAGENITADVIKNGFLGKAVISHTLLEAIKNQYNTAFALIITVLITFTWAFKTY